MSDNDLDKKAGMIRFGLLILLFFSAALYLKAIISYQAAERSLAGVEKVGGNDAQKPFVDLYFTDVDARDISGSKAWMDGSMKRKIPELKDVHLKKGEMLVRFDIKLENRGNQKLSYDPFITLFVWQGDGDFLEPNEDLDTYSVNTRYIPPGRKVRFTRYAIIEKKRFEECVLNLFDTKDGREETWTIHHIP